MDRDNVLGPRFFTIAAALIAREPDVDIIQPEIRPFPDNFRRALNGGESACASNTVPNCTLLPALNRQNSLHDRHTLHLACTILCTHQAWHSYTASRP